MKPLCKRTLRRQVLEYVQVHEPPRAGAGVRAHSEEEQRLYDLVSDYLQRPTLYALPASQRQLDDADPAQAAGIVDVRHLRHAGGLVQRLEAAAQAATASDSPAGRVARGLGRARRAGRRVGRRRRDCADPNGPASRPSNSPSCGRKLRSSESSTASPRSIIKNSKGEVLLTALRRGFAAAAEAQQNRARDTPAEGRHLHRIPPNAGISVPRP